MRSPDASSSRPRIGLVLGAGGTVGAAWLVGALDALADQTGWDPRTAEFIVGTSAGAAVGSICGAGVAPEHLAAFAAGRSLDELEQIDGLDELRLRDDPLDPDAAAALRLRGGLPWPGPGSLRLALGTLRRPWRYSPGLLMCGWLPCGMFSGDPIRRLIERFVPEGWPSSPALRIVAADYCSGDRVVFGGPGAPEADLPDAVVASCAIPGIYEPVKIGDRRYVDGGVCSLSNLDLLCDARLDLVICLNPCSSRDRVGLGGALDAMAALMRRVAGRQLAAETRRLREAGTRVVLLQPTAEDLAAMGPNLMSRNRRVEVVEVAARTTARQLRRREMRNALEPLSASAPPSSAPATAGRPLRAVA